MALSKKEQQYIAKIAADMKFYKEYKKFMGHVKVIYLEKGPEAAKEYIQSEIDTVLSWAIDEMLSDLFRNL